MLVVSPSAKAFGWPSIPEGAQPDLQHECGGQLRERIIALLKEERCIDNALVDQMRAWRHSGFSSHYDGFRLRATGIMPTGKSYPLDCQTRA